MTERRFEISSWLRLRGPTGAGGILAGVVWAVVLACASPPDEPDRAQVLFGSVGQNLLILPLNLTVPMPPKLEVTAPIVWNEIERYLRDHGKELKTVSEKNAVDFWSKSVIQAKANAKGANVGFDEAARIMVQRLSAYAEFDTVVAPTLFIREAPVFEKIAAWDGVERAIEFDAVGRAARKIADETPLEGAAPASSIHIVVLDAMGNKVQEAQGGLDLLVRVRVTADADGPDFEYVRRSDLFADRANIREGIAVALAPFLPRLAP